MAIQASGESLSFPTPEQIDAHIQRQHHRLDQEIVDGKAGVLALARRHGVSHLSVSYDGEGDEGTIMEIVAHRAAPGRLAMDAVEVDATVLFDDGSGEGPSLAAKVDDLAWAILARHYSGFEINSGGYGELLIDITAGTFTLEHSIRVIDAIHETVDV